ncbi:hypothetical protein WR25_11996 isoform C [Diploscapter pachys]|nr:hypothetical protein WR25_11996 isoform C [Diploscapter pachys]
MIAAGIALGGRLELFEALAQVGSEEKPATPKEVAEKAGCKERYIKEWLGAMACGEIIEVTQDERFYIKPEHIQFLNSSNIAITQPSMNIAVLEPYSKLMEVMKKEGPLGLTYDNYSKFYEEMARVSESLHRQHLFSDFIPLLGIQDKLESGSMKILDVGCGNGLHAALMAEHFPNSQFFGIDLSEKAIGQAKNRRKESNREEFKNLEFRTMDAGKMDPNWSDTFDMVLIFDSCHDQMRPDLCMKEIHRVLKPGCQFAMVEIKSTSNIYKDRELLGKRAVFPYAASLLHCLPVGSNSPGKT